MKPSEALALNKESWEREASRFYGRAALPEYGPLAPAETELSLFEEIKDKRVLDIGCGSGHSLKYMGDEGAMELWGLDLTALQIKTATEVLQDQTASVKLFESPMEENPGIPEHYFDMVYSIYALGWTTDLKRTLQHVNGYLKPGGTFIFSWEHPMHDRLVYENGNFIMSKSYHIEGPELNEAWHSKAVIPHRKLSTYLNTLIACGFVIDRVVEEAVLPDILPDDDQKWYSAQKASLTPATFIIKASKK
ncbi:class I SAM-dependent methyltransferase [Jeotgalibacillus malaysiensis]|uniref:class I SAM-dependent methyltransferase n=1 Tax=Jeotgalibacillus malaysiensis TaxID=1508404 RepID=UPI003850306A